jgi:hypothetical protein
MCVLNFDRYIAMLHPMTHRSEVTKKKLLKFTVLGLVLQTVFVAVSVVDVNVTPYVLAAITLVLIATSVYVYARIFFSVHKAARQHKWKIRKELRLAVSSFMIVICFLLCFLPSTIGYIGRLRVEPTFPLIVRRRRFALLSILSTTLNPVIFFWRDQAMRAKGLALLKRPFFSRETRNSKTNRNSKVAHGQRSNSN